MTTTYERYIALGDSISIDVYPASDAHRRHPGRAHSDDLGAVSLLHRNDEGLWPEFRGRDLLSFNSNTEKDDLTSDGATTQTLLRQIERVPRGDEPTLITITAGGNDLLGQIGGRSNPVPAISERFRAAVERLLELRTNVLILAGTVYDPSDGTNRLSSYETRPLDREAEWLAAYNHFIRDLARSDSRIALADIHKHFLGHGLSVPEEQRWYLRESIIEPSAHGASEVRRLWLEAIGR